MKFTSVALSLSLSLIVQIYHGYLVFGSRIVYPGFLCSGGARLNFLNDCSTTLIFSPTVDIKLNIIQEKRINFCGYSLFIEDFLI